MHLNGNFFCKVDYLNAIEAKVMILSGYVKPNETIIINKFQRLRLTFDLSGKVAHIGVQSTYKNIVFSETTRPIELKFHVWTPYDKLAKIYTKYFALISKMATTPIYGKNPLEVFFSRTRRPMTLGLGM